MEPITSFHGKYRFLSNFWLIDIKYGDDVYRSVEHAYQASKCYWTLDAMRIRDTETPGKAKRLAQRMDRRTDWELVKEDIMLNLVKQKFMEHAALGFRLMQTKDAELIEGNTWGDRYWGAVYRNGEWEGDNRLGKMLMYIRDLLEQ